jgi:prolyl 4-hydroxylase
VIIKTVDNFLTEEECKKIISLIDDKNERSAVIDDGSYGIRIDENRTSSTSYFDNTIPIISDVRNKIANYLNIDSKKIEPLQGQKYLVGQYFKPHFDFLFSSEEYQKIKEAGNRYWTLLIYLNDDFEGGKTNFPKLEYEISPKKGMALIFQNMRNGELIQESLHEGKDVLSGFKYIITAWIREKNYDT